jgi:hypothetical protein
MSVAFMPLHNFFCLDVVLLVLFLQIESFKIQICFVFKLVWKMENHLQNRKGFGKLKTDLGPFSPISWFSTLPWHGPAGLGQPTSIPHPTPPRSPTNPPFAAHSRPSGPGTGLDRGRTLGPSS